MNRKSWYRVAPVTLVMGVAVSVALYAWTQQGAYAQEGPPPQRDSGREFDSPPPPPPPSQGDGQGYDRPGPHRRGEVEPQGHEQRFGPPPRNHERGGQYPEPRGRFEGQRGPGRGPACDREGGPGEGRGPAWDREGGPGEGRGPGRPDGNGRPQPPDPDTLFADMDADGNGSVSKEELRAFHESHRPPMMGPPRREGSDDRQQRPEPPDRPERPEGPSARPPRPDAG